MSAGEVGPSGVRSEDGRSERTGLETLNTDVLSYAISTNLG